MEIDLINNAIASFEIEYETEKITFSNKSIGQGGTSIVYKSNCGKYALKVLYKEFFSNNDTFKRFKQEFINLKGSNSNYFVKVYDLYSLNVVDQSLPCILLKYYKKTFKKEYVLRELNIIEIEDIVKSLVVSISEIHNQKIIHRDLKPENIFIHENRFIIADFGIAKFSNNMHAVLVETKKGDRLANFQFSASEQFRKGGVVDNSTDFFALGNIIYWLIFKYTPRGALGSEITDKLGKGAIRIENLVESLLMNDQKNRINDKEHILNILKYQKPDLYKEYFYKYNLKFRNYQDQLMLWYESDILPTKYTCMEVYNEFSNLNELTKKSKLIVMLILLSYEEYEFDFLVDIDDFKDMMLNIEHLDNIVCCKNDEELFWDLEHPFDMLGYDDPIYDFTVNNIGNVMIKSQVIKFRNYNTFENYSPKWIASLYLEIEFSGKYFKIILFALEKELIRVLKYVV